MTFTIKTDRKLIRPTHRSNRFVVAEIVAPPSRREHARPPVNLAFVVDRSGSMGGQKLHLAKQAVFEAVGRLHPEDRFAIVVYDEEIDVVVPTTVATAEARRDAIGRLGQVEPRGSTNLSGGWLRGCEQIALVLSAQGVNRCLLLTDGLANVGITDRDELARHASELRTRGVTTTTFGVGEDFDEVLLQSMAQAGGGHFYFIASPASIRDHITSEVGETLDIVARDVTIEVTAPDGVQVESLSPYPVRERAGRTEIVVGDLASDQQLSVVFRVHFPYGQVSDRVAVLFALADRADVLAEQPEGIRWEYADDQANNAQDRDRDVDRAVARVFAARARQEAVRLNRKGDFDGARRALKSTARRVSEYAGRDHDLREILAQLEQETAVMAAPMPEMQRKVAFAAASYLQASRAPDGTANKASRPSNS